jgi:hypothetical protein
MLTNSVTAIWTSVLRILLDGIRQRQGAHRYRNCTFTRDMRISPIQHRSWEGYYEIQFSPMGNLERMDSHYCRYWIDVYLGC